MPKGFLQPTPIACFGHEGSSIQTFGPIWVTERVCMIQTSFHGTWWKSTGSAYSIRFYTTVSKWLYIQNRDTGRPKETDSTCWILGMKLYCSSTLINDKLQEVSVLLPFGTCVQVLSCSYSNWDQRRFACKLVTWVHTHGNEICFSACLRIVVHGGGSSASVPCLLCFCWYYFVFRSQEHKEG